MMHHLLFSLLTVTWHFSHCFTGKTLLTNTSHLHFAEPYIQYFALILFDLPEIFIEVNMLLYIASSLSFHNSNAFSCLTAAQSVFLACFSFCGCFLNLGPQVLIMVSFPLSIHCILDLNQYDDSWVPDGLQILYFAFHPQCNSHCPPAY